MWNWTSHAERWLSGWNHCGIPRGIEGQLFCEYDGVKNESSPLASFLGPHQLGTGCFPTYVSTSTGTPSEAGARMSVRCC